MGHPTATISGMNKPGRLIPASHIAVLIRDALASGKEETAIRLLTEAASRLLEMPDGETIPDSILAEPESTGDLRYDTLLAIAFAFALAKHGVPALSWMTKPPLATEWLWGGDGGESKAYTDLIRRDTPTIFLDVNILVREKDLTCW